MKKIIFFDGDGTLWYPKKTKYKEHPVWIYRDPVTAKDPDKHSILIPTVLTTLKRLKKVGMILVVLSTHPHPPKEASSLIKRKIKHFQLDELFDEVHATREYHGSKGDFMLKILLERGIPKSKALMVGDTYDWDYMPARKVGIDALLIENEYFHKRVPPKGRVTRKIKRMEEVLNYIN